MTMKTMTNGTRSKTGDDSAKTLILLMRYLLKRTQEAPFHDRTAQKYRKAFSLTVQLLHRLLTGEIDPTDLKPLTNLLDKSGLGAKIMESMDFDGEPGSGNFGHKVRPGEVGGSAESDKSSHPRGPYQKRTFWPNREQDFNCPLRYKIGKRHFRNIRKALDACPDEKLKFVWYDHEKSIFVADAHCKGTAHCAGNSIYVNIEQDSLNPIVPYYDTFHEVGHALDGLGAHSLWSRNKTGENKNNVPDLRRISLAYKDGKFPSTISTEVYAWIKSIRDRHNCSYSGACYEIQNKINNRFSKRQRRDLSDILNGATNGKIDCGFGHFQRGYWTQETLATEAFAEMTAATIANPESLAVIKRYLPQSYDVYQEIIGFLVDHSKTRWKDEFFKK